MVTINVSEEFIDALHDLQEFLNKLELERIDKFKRYLEDVINDYAIYHGGEKGLKFLQEDAEYKSWRDNLFGNEYDKWNYDAGEDDWITAIKAEKLIKAFA